MDAQTAAAETAQRGEIDAVLNYAYVLFDRGWVAEAHRICSQIADIGFSQDQTRYSAIKAAYAALDPKTASTGAHQPSFLIKGQQVLSTLHFTSELTDHQKRLAFKSAVRKVDIETSTQCNRLCRYCSNLVNDRRSKNVFMDQVVYEKLIDQLAEIDYVGRVSFVGHNEPMMHMDDLSERIRYARLRLPRARLAVFTNGDYLNADSLKLLEDCGLSVINMTVHLSTDKPFDECEALRRALDKAKKLALKPEMDVFMKGVRFAINLIGSPLEIRIRHANMMAVGHSEGGVMEGVGLKVTERTMPCQQPYYAFIVGYNGNVHPCSLVVADVPDHVPFITGNVRDSSIFDIYASQAYVRFRRMMMPISAKPGVCATCPSYLENYDAQWNQMMQGLMTEADRITAMSTSGPAANLS
jgi:hypothetical protein